MSRNRNKAWHLLLRAEMGWGMKWWFPTPEVGFATVMFSLTMEQFKRSSGYLKIFSLESIEEREAIDFFSGCIVGFYRDV